MSENHRGRARGRNHQNTKDHGEMEMVQTGDSRHFNGGQKAAEGAEGGGGGFAQPKGVHTRKAIASHLAKKLKIAEKAELQTLMEFDRQVRAETQPQDDFWKKKLKEERLRLNKTRHEQEEELRNVINQAHLDDFPMTEPTVVMMTQDLQEKLKRENMSSKNVGGGDATFLISCQNPWRKRWSYLIIVVAMYSVAFIPMRIAVYKTVLDPLYDYFDFFTFMLYVADLFINLRTTFLDSFGEEIKDPGRVMNQYVKSVGFWIDLISLFNYPTSVSPILNMVGILKVNRVLRISTLITQSNMEKGPKIMMQMLYYYMLFIIYLHIIACLWFLFCEETYQLSKKDSRYQAWIPPYDFYDGTDNFWERYETQEEQIFLYLVCLYYSVLVIGGNEMGPKELPEIIFMVIINLTGAIFQAYIFGELAVLIAQVGRKSQEQQSIIDTANTAMDNVNLPDSLRKDIREYFQTVMITMQQQQELDKFIQNISPSLALRVRGHMFENVLNDHNKIIKQTQLMIIAAKDPNKDSKSNQQIALTRSIEGPIESDSQNRADRLMDTIVVTLDTTLMPPDDAVVKQDVDPKNDDDVDMFFVGTGHCKVKVRDQNGNDQWCGTLNEGDHFGEISMIYKCKRSATVYSSNYNTFARIAKPRFREIVSEFPEYEIALKKNAIKTYRDKKIQFVLRMIKRVEYLAKHDDEVLFDLMFSLQPVTKEKDEIVLTEETPADALYFIEEGIVEAYTKFENNEFVLEQLNKGSAINHRAFFMQDYMYVNFRMQTDGKLLVLNHTRMKELIQKYEDKPFGRDLLIYQNKILKQERKFPCDYVLHMPRNIMSLTEEQCQRENALKNVIMRIVIEIRERKKRPNLSDFVAIYREKKNEQGANTKDVKKEFRNKFHILYGTKGDEDIGQQQTDQKIEELMTSFNRVKGQLDSQQQQLGKLIKSVNALIDHRDKKENQINRGGRGKDFKKAQQKQFGKTRSQTQSVSSELPMMGDSAMQFARNQGKSSGKTMAPIEEAKIPEGEQTQSARDRAQEHELNVINEGYMNAKEDSDLPILAKPQIKKPSSHQAERTFEPFKSPFVDEIINTSKEIHGELSQKTIQENQSQASDQPAD